MSRELPAPIAGYFAAENSDDTEALTACFSPDAVVRDEGRRIQGIAAIKAWKREGKAKYQHKIKVIAADEANGETVVRGLVSGNFPGSPIELAFVFALKDGMIAALEVRP
ncbi:MAG TPA: nuclear transport factor 2 family protein [Dongiaceae bacterium]|jgi:hypothetical protein